MDADSDSCESGGEPENDLPVGRTLKAVFRAGVEGRKFYPKAGEIVEMDFERGSMGLAARKMLLLLLQNCGADAGQDRTFTITKKELRGSHDSNDRLIGILDELMNVKVKLKTTSSRNRPAVLTSPLMAWNIEEISDDGMSVIEYRLSDAARVAIAGSDYYAQIRMAVAMAFQAKYAFTLYELGALYLRRRDASWKGTIAEFRSRVGVPEESYKNFAQLRREVLQKAKDEIDQLADFTMNWDEIRGDGRGRPVVSLVISFVPKDTASVDEAARELDRPKIGRGARREGSVEELVGPNVVKLEQPKGFPAGTMHFCPDPRLSTIVSDFGGGWDRDVIADAYRKHMGFRIDDLRGEPLYKSFEGFVKSFVQRRGKAR